MNSLISINCVCQSLAVSFVTPMNVDVCSYGIFSTGYVYVDFCASVVRIQSKTQICELVHVSVRTCVTSRCACVLGAFLSEAEGT